MRKKTSLRLSSAVFCALAVWKPTDVLAQCEVQKLSSPTPGGYDGFGYSVSLSGPHILVGVPNTSGNCVGGGDCGMALAFRSNGQAWHLEQTLGLLGSPGDHLGSSVSVSGEVAVVGVPARNCTAGSDCGAAFVYRFNGTTWIEEQKLTASDGTEDDSFGTAVALDGDICVIGAYLHGCSYGRNCGAAYIYRYDGSTWIEEQKLAALDTTRDNWFGASVSISGPVAVVGAPLADCETGEHRGSAYVFRRNGSTWVQEQEFHAIDTASWDGFGMRVSVSGDVIALGKMPFDCDVRPNCESVYVYRHQYSRWDFEDELTPAVSMSEFGTSLYLNSNSLIIGTPGESCGNGSRCGAAYVYHFNGAAWILRQKLTASDAAQGDAFGSSVSASQDVVLIGAPGRECEPWTDCGAAYLFALGPDCNGNGQADFCDIRDDLVDDGNADGVPDECELLASLDIEPGKCPNRVRSRERGNIKAALAGSEAFDVTAVDAESLELRRADGVGGSIRPLRRSDGHSLAGENRISHNEDRTRIRDAATFHADHSCECGDDGRDGFDDLILKFDAKELIEAFELDAEEPGASIRITLSGSMLDGAIFNASDCIVVAGRDHDSAQPLNRN